MKQLSESLGGKVEGRVFGCLEAEAANQAGSLLDSRFSYRDFVFLELN